MTRPSLSCSSRYAITSLSKRLKTIFKKAYELSTLCDIGVCVIYYGPNGELKTWPKEREVVKDMALRYTEAKKRKKSLNLHEFMEKQRAKEKDENPKKKKRTVKGFKYPDWYPNFDHYSPQQLSQLIQSLELTLLKLQERLRFVEAQKQSNTCFLPPNQLLNPNQFSQCVYNRGDSTTLSASQYSQLTNYQTLDHSALKEPVLPNHLMMQQELQGFDQNNMFMNGVTNRNVQDLPSLSQTQGYSALLSLQASQLNNNRLKNHLMQQQELYHNMSDINNINFFEQPCLSNTVVPLEFRSDFEKNPYGVMVGSTSFSQEFPQMLSSYGESSLLQTSSLYTIPNSYFHSDNNSRFL